MTNKRKLISSGSAFEEMVGYSRAVVDGEWIFVSGTTGYNYSDAVLQCRLNGVYSFASSLF